MLKSTFLLAFALAGALFIGGCNENTTDPVTGTKPNAPTAIMAQSASATSVKIKWTAPTGTFDNYHVKVMDGTTLVQEDKAVAKTATTYTATGLTEGKAYSFEVMTVSGTEMSSAVKITWAPATRAGGTFRLYSGNNNTEGSGLNIFGTAAPSVKKVAEGALWDICFDDDGGTFVGSPGQSRYVEEVADRLVFKQAPTQEARLIFLGRLYTGINSLDEIYESEDLSIIPATSKFEEKLIDLASVTDKTKGVGFVCRYKVDDDTRYYAKVVVKSDGTSIVRGSGSNAFIEVEVSYQKEKNVPYAKSN
ncbi:MAG TPA: fibronectin type III domain-containing protein [Candidatus Kapabacteria bacterium]|jgi:hypothetical protein|nr:fibronectin type III domain-containing protein [Ignavibacteria bacterium]HRK59719.1 fibronectin type III domain-containing protein [Candidatus Kapabacteria bacterium]